ncbi:MAG: hypothetical protein JNM72_21640, partial [Deltaproteobacteria bacterium]|nr:hypothetical protein [Deltaproteobacteria bacterium]
MSPVPGFIAGLRTGLLRPSGLSLGLAALTAALTLLLGLRAADEDLLRSGRLAVDPVDDYAFLTAAALRPPPPPGAVVVLGSSALREAIADPAALATAAGAPVAALWTAGGLSHLELLVLVEHLPVDPGRLTLLELSERNLSLGAAEAQALLDRPRLPLDSPAQDAAAARAGLRPPRRSAALALRHPGFFLARLSTLLRRGPAPLPIQHQVEALAPARPADYLRWARRLAGWWADLPAESHRNTALYVDLVEALRARGGAVLLVAAPRNPRVVAEAAQGDPGGPAAAEAARAAVAQAAGASLVDPAAGVGLKPEDYADYAHLVR